MCYNVLQCGAACCCVLQRVAACCSVLQRVAASYEFWALLYCVWSAWYAIAWCSVVKCDAASRVCVYTVCGRVLQRVAVYCSGLPISHCVCGVRVYECVC